MYQIQFKRGSSLIIQGQAKDGDAGKDLTGWGVESSASFMGSLLCNFTVTFVDRALGIFQISGPPTSQWPIGLIDSDIKYTSPSGQFIHTETFQINCQASITK